MERDGEQQRQTDLWGSQEKKLFQTTVVTAPRTGNCLRGAQAQKEQKRN